MKKTHTKANTLYTKQSKVQSIVQTVLGKSPDTDNLYLNPDIMRTVLDSTPAGIGIIKNDVVLWVNKALCSMLDYDQDFLIGKDHQIFYADQREYDRITMELYPKIQQYGTGLTETKIIKKDGTLLHCRIRASQTDKKDSSKGIIFVITDISDIKLLQIQMHQAQKMEAIGTLAGGVSHDFNNILMGIQGHLTLMQIEMTNVEKIKSHTEQIEQLVETASELTKRLLGFARGGKYQVSVFNINKLLPAVLKIFNPEEKNILIHESYDKNLHLVDADYNQLEQVFTGILMNASEAISGDGEIFITTKNIVIALNHEYPF